MDLKQVAKKVVLFCFVVCVCVRVCACECVCVCVFGNMESAAPYGVSYPWESSVNGGWTHDQVTGSTPSGSGGRMLTSQVNFLCRFFVLSLVHPSCYSSGM